MKSVCRHGGPGALSSAGSFDSLLRTRSDVLLALAEKAI
jgi:hypothetical protein